MKRTLALALALVPAAVPAHIVFAEPEAQAGASYIGHLRVSHACGSSPTVSLRVEIPEGVEATKPQPKPGWTIAVERAPLAHPFKSESGALVTERVSAVRWTGNLPADQFDEFGLMLRLPAKAGPLYFPTVQQCASGSNAWVNRPVKPEAWHETPMPAPMLIVTDRSAEHAMHMADH